MVETVESLSGQLLTVWHPLSIFKNCTYDPNMDYKEVIKNKYWNLIFILLNIEITRYLEEDLEVLNKSVERIPALKEDGTPRMLMKRGVGLVPYPPVLPTYSTPIEH